MQSDLQGAKLRDRWLKTALVVRGSHNIDIPIKGQFQKNGSAEVGQTQSGEKLELTSGTGGEVATDGGAGC